MDDMHMNQVQFAEFLQQSPATLSSIFTKRTRPTINILEAIKNKVPQISLEWLMMGLGEMYTTPQASTITAAPQPTEQLIAFDEQQPSTAPQPSQQRQMPEPIATERPTLEVKTSKREPRHVTEIRVYYDDQTFETFTPLKAR